MYEIKRKYNNKKNQYGRSCSTLFFLKNLFFPLVHGLSWQVDVYKKRFYICSEVTDSITDANSACLGRGLGGLDVVCGGMVVVWDGFGLTWQLGQSKKNAFKDFLKLLILTQKLILGVKKVVWDGLEVVWGVSTDPDR